MAIQPSKAFHRIAKLTAPIRVIQGSSSAGKTYSIMQRLVIQALWKGMPKKTVSIVTDTYPNLKRGAFQDFKEICESGNVNVDIPKQPGDVELGAYTFQFFSVDDEKKARGGRRDILFINEANRLDWEIARQLIMRARDTVYIDYNPDRLFWVNEKYINPGKCDFLIITYKDNEFAPQFAIDEIESYRTTDPEWFKVYGLGLLGDIKGALFSGLQYFNGDVEGVHLTTTDLKDKGDDYFCTVNAVLKDGLIYIDEVIYTQDNPEITVPRTQELINSKHSEHNYLEINFGGSFALSQFQDGCNYQILPLRNSTNKLTRIINESRFIKKYFRFRDDGNEEYKHFVEHVRFYTGEKGQPDDAPDCLEMMSKVVQAVFYHEFYKE